MTNAQIFRVLDQIAAGIEREAKLSDEEREAKREEILAWFRPLHARLMAAYFERPCPIPCTVVLQEGVDVPPLPDLHECADCFNVVYAARFHDPVAADKQHRRMTSDGNPAFIATLS